MTFPSRPTTPERAAKRDADAALATWRDRFARREALT